MYFIELSPIRLRRIVWLKILRLKNPIAEFQLHMSGFLISRVIADDQL